MKTSNKLRATIALVCMISQSLMLVLISESSVKAKDSSPIAGEVSVGKPSLWSFAQAHYLLANLRERSQAIQTKGLTDRDLDANAVNRTRIDMLRSIVSGEVGFDQSIGTQNQLKLQQHQNNLQRSNALQATLDQRRNEFLNAVHDITVFESRRARLNAELPTPIPANPPPDVVEKQKTIKKLEKLIEVRTAEKTALDAEMDVITKQLGVIDTALGATALQSVFGTETPKTPTLTGLLTKEEILAVLGANQANSPKLTASTALDNYIQLQYELIAKQLTLLRDEVGPNQRIVFLELPCSIYLSPKNADGALAQVRWKIARYSKQGDTSGPQPKALTYQQLRNNQWLEAGSDGSNFHVIDVIPRQSALNVSEVHNTVSGFNLAAKAVWLFGLGAKVAYERQRELYDQFIYQEMFASGFGKGEEEFGWTFGPLPGTTRIAPGLRTTYAVVSIPSEATAIEIQGSGFSFPRKEGPAKFTGAASTKKFTLLIPREGNGFDLSSIDYVRVESGEQLTAILRGKYFSPQIGILVNGVPLRRVLEIASFPKPAVGKPEGAADGAAPPSPAASPPQNPADSIAGEFEYVSSETIIMKWKMPPEYEGIPIITLVTPEFTSSINGMALNINGDMGKTLFAVGAKDPMFFKPLEITGVVINGVAADNTVSATVLGNGFKPGAVITVNTEQVQRPSLFSTRKYDIEFKKPVTQNWHVAISQDIQQGLEEASFDTQPATAAISYKISHFEPSNGPNDRAKLDVIFQGGAVRLDVRARNKNEATVSEGIPVEDAISKHIETKVNPLQLEIIRGAAIVETVTLHWPLKPKITGLFNESTGASGQASGIPEGGYRVWIKGKNLQLVREVRFGRTDATIQDRMGDTLVVIAPPGQGRVFVTLKTGRILEGNSLFNVDDFEGSAAYFEYRPPTTDQVAKATKQNDQAQH